MKYCKIIPALIIFAWLGCDSDEQLTDLTITEQAVTLTGGGRWFETSDTGTYYDANVQFKIENPASVTKLMTYDLIIGLDVGGSVDTTSLRSRSGLIVSNGTFILDPNTPITVNDNFIIDIGRPDRDWSKSYRYKLTVHDVEGGKSFTSEGNISGSTDLNRFHGILYTTEQSPDPLTILDAPDDGDYDDSMSGALNFLPLFPNPIDNVFNVMYELQEIADVEIRINSTPLHTINSYSFTGSMPGTHSLYIDTAKLVPGQYRVYIQATTKNNKSFRSFGDLMVNKF